MNCRASNARVSLLGASPRARRAPAGRSSLPAHRPARTPPGVLEPAARQHASLAAIASRSHCIRVEVLPIPERFSADLVPILECSGGPRLELCNGSVTMPVWLFRCWGGR